MIAIGAALVSLMIALWLWDFPGGGLISTWRWYAGVVAYSVGLALALYGMTILEAMHADRLYAGYDGRVSPSAVNRDHVP